MRIFAVVLKIYVNFPDFMPTPDINEAKLYSRA